MKIMLDDTELQHIDSATYLGITFDKRQTRKTHISRAETKARQPYSENWLEPNGVLQKQC